MIAAGMVTTATMTSTTAMPSNRGDSMNPLAPNTPVKVATVGIKTSTTMLRVSDQDRASRIKTAPATTTGTEHASAMPAISQLSVAGIPVLTPHVATTPDGLHPVLVTQFRPEPLDVHGDGGEVAKVPLPHHLQQFLAGEHDSGVGEEEQQKVELAVGEADRLALDGHRAGRGRHRHVTNGHDDGWCAERRRCAAQHR